MTFKENWEKADQNNTLTNQIILNMLASHYTEKNAIQHFSIISGGCSNIHARVHLNHTNNPVILRIYLQDQNKAYIERAITDLLRQTVPTPIFHCIKKFEHYTFAITSHLPGITLRDYLLGTQNPDLNKIMYKVGQVLGVIASHPFPQAGFFDKSLNIINPFRQNDLVEYCNTLLLAPHINQCLSPKQRKIIRSIIQAHSSILPTHHQSNLVHGDFDPANILVNERNGTMEVSGVLDWEFSFSGSSLWDGANMLRYAHQMPKSFQDSFIEGWTGSGYPLPQHWNKLIHLLNLLSLLDCLIRSTPKTTPHRTKDILALINHILEQFNSTQNH